MITLDEIKAIKDTYIRCKVMNEYKANLKERKRKNKAEMRKGGQEDYYWRQKMINLSWVDIIRKMKYAGCSDKEIVAGLLEHGIVEEKRITEQLAERRKQNEQSRKMDGES